MSRHGIVPRIKRRKIQEAISSGKRVDGRELKDLREISVKIGILDKAEGSAEVRLGDTWVMAGVKISIGAPFEDTPDKGVLICNAEFVPIASPLFEPGPPNESSIELARVVDRGLRSAEVFDFSKLSLISGEKVYIIYLDLYILNHGGNLIDASAIAAIAALRNTIKPVYEVNEGKIVLTDKKEPLDVRKVTVAVTIVKIGDGLLVDPTADEEEVMDTRLTLSIDEESNICAVQKSGSEGLTKNEIKEALELALERAGEISSKIAETG